MSLNLLKVRPWLLFLLDDSNLKQSKFLLSSPSDHQIKALNEIFYNIHSNSDVPVESQVVRKLNKSKKWNRFLKSKSITFKKKFIKQNKNEILLLLLKLKDILTEIIENV